MVDRFVVTGCGRSGTRYVSQLLTAAGVPCGHETAHSHTARGVWPPGMVADSSWMAATMLEVVECPVVLLVRHPLAVVRSWVEIGFFGWDIQNPTHGPLREFAPHVYDHPEPQDRALAMWLALTEATLGRAELLLRLEDLTAQPINVAGLGATLTVDAKAGTAVLGRLLRWCGGDPARAEAAWWSTGPANRHEVSRRRTGVQWDPSWRAVDGELALRGRQLARTLGYNPDEVS